MSLSLHRFAAIGIELSLLTATVYAQPEAPTTPKTKKAPKPKDPNTPTKPKTPRVQGTTYIRVLHAVANGPSVDVYIDGGKKSENIGFKSISDYFGVPSGLRTISLKKAGTQEEVAMLKKTAMADKHYVVAAVTMDAKPNLLMQNEETGKPNPAKASLRVYHLVPGAPAVQITTPSARGKDKMRTMLKDLEFGKSRSATLPTGTASVQVRLGDKLLKEVPATVEAGKRYAAFAIGSAGDVNLVVAPVGK